MPTNLQKITEPTKKRPSGFSLSNDPAENKHKEKEQAPKCNFLVIFLKILFAIGVLVGIGLLSYSTLENLFSPRDEKETIVLQSRYKRVLWKNLGYVFEPVVTVPLYYPGYGYLEKDFLVDSGAVISSLPREEAKQRGIHLSDLQRTAFAGYGGSVSFAYKGSVRIKIDEQLIELPVVFTEAQGTKRILGRAGFFEKYSVLFNRRSKSVEVF